MVICGHHSLGMQRHLDGALLTFRATGYYGIICGARDTPMLLFITYRFVRVGLEEWRKGGRR